MLSIALIAASLLITGFILQLRGRNTAQRAILVPGPIGLATIASPTRAAPVPTTPAPQIVAIVLRVQNPGCACENARKFADKTFLVGDAPELPFKTCTRADCSCRYERIANRRRLKSERRITAGRREQIRFETKEDRRSDKDRRQTNNLWKTPA